MANTTPYVSDLPEGKQSDCQAGFTSREVMQHEQSCVICRDDTDKTQKPVIFKAGVNYKKCSPVVVDPSPDAEDCVVVPMTDKSQEIIGVVMSNALDLTDETENCPGLVLRCATFDINRMCWPMDDKGEPLLSVEDLKLIAFNHDKPCFSTRLGCPILPDYYQTIAATVTK